MAVVLDASGGKRRRRKYTQRNDGRLTELLRTLERVSLEERARAALQMLCWIKMSHSHTSSLPH
jgi:hypothetical protein